LELAGGNGIKTVYDLQSYWTSMAAILASLFSLSEWLKFLLQVYIELTAESSFPGLHGCHDGVTVVLYIDNKLVQKLEKLVLPGGRYSAWLTQFIMQA
jgi:hypothetical protein